MGYVYLKCEVRSVHYARIIFGSMGRIEVDFCSFKKMLGLDLSLIHAFDPS